MGKGRSSAGAGRIALVGVLTALSVIFLYLAALTPTGQLGVVAAAGLMPAAAVVKAIFMVVVTDGVFAMIFATIGI